MNPTEGADPSSDQSLLREALKTIAAGEYLSWSQSKTMAECLMSANLEDPRLAALAAGVLCALKTRGESVNEIVGAARCLQERQISVPMAVPGQVLVDTCGTGGDGAHLINISTLAALVTASLGVKVAKHGNRSVSSACGSADLLEEMGYPLLSDPARVAANVAGSGFGFLFAPHFHPALRNLAALRRTLGVRTLFNLLGPLVNPAGVTHQVIGVYSQDLLQPLAWATSRLGLMKALIVHGEGGLDELSPWGTTWVYQSECGKDGIQGWEWTPQSFGAPRIGLESLRGGNAKHNALIALELLAGGRPEIAAVVAMNTAAALWVAEVETDLQAGYARAYEALRSGEVGRYFQRCLAEASAGVSTRSDLSEK
jgi:anthranilate phosphoribosyltransferase